jgi:hypothetical protein
MSAQGWQLIQDGIAIPSDAPNCSTLEPALREFVEHDLSRIFAMKHHNVRLEQSEFLHQMASAVGSHSRSRSRRSTDLVFGRTFHQVRSDNPIKDTLIRRWAARLLTSASRDTLLHTVLPGVTEDRCGSLHHAIVVPIEIMAFDLVPLS